MSKLKRREEPKQDKIKDTDVESFIKALSQYEILWNTDLKGLTSSNRARVMSSWKEVAAQFGVSVSAAKLKYKVLRDVFRRELKKYPDMTSPEEYDGKWVYFHDLWFLRKYMSTVASNNSHEVYEDQDDDFNQQNIMYLKGDDREDIYFEQEVESNRLEDDVDRLSIKRKKQDTTENEDYDLMFFKSLLPYIRTLTPKRKLVVQSKIQKIILSEMSGDEIENQLDD